MIRNGFLLLAPVLMAAACATLASCGAAEGDKPGGATMKIESPAFKEGGVIPKKHTGEGADVSPALAWSGAPAGVKEFALICDDPDAPTPQPWVHWVVYNIPPDTKSCLQWAKDALAAVGTKRTSGPAPRVAHSQGRGTGPNQPREV